MDRFNTKVSEYSTHNLKTDSISHTDLSAMIKKTETIECNSKRGLNDRSNFYFNLINLIALRIDKHKSMQTPQDTGNNLIKNHIDLDHIELKNQI